MVRADVIIIGAGVLGCFAARAMAEYDLKVIVTEAREDVCTGVTRANTGIVYTGGDTKPGTLKTRLCVAANAGFDRLCRELDVPFSRCGSLMISMGQRGDRVLEKKLAQGMENAVPGLELLPREEVLRLEPELSPKVTGGLYSPGTGTVNPWELGIAAYENARDNGVEFRLNEEILSIKRRDGGFVLESGGESYFCRAIINCAGLSADVVREFSQRPLLRIVPSAGEYLVLDDKLRGFVRHVIFHEPEQKGKGLTLVPTVDGNILAGPTEHDGSGEDFAADIGGLELLERLCALVVPGLPLERTIRSFAARRPNPYYVHQENGVWRTEDKSISSFTLLDEEGLFSLVGIKTPGLTCAAELGALTAAKAAAFLGCDAKNSRFEPRRRGIKAVRGLSAEERNALIASDPDYGRIVCRCRGVSLAEVKQAIARGAVTVDGVKRRTGAGMGRCQGGYCMQTVLETLARENKLAPEQVCKDGWGTEIVYGKL